MHLSVFLFFPHETANPETDECVPGHQPTKQMPTFVENDVQVYPHKKTDKTRQQHFIGKFHIAFR